MPAHAFLVGLELARGRARDGDEADVAVIEMDDDAVEIVGPERTALAALVPTRVEHEMENDQLLASVEQLGQGLPAAAAVENIVLLDPLPRQLAALPAQLIAQPGEFLLLGEQLL